MKTNISKRLLKSGGVAKRLEYLRGELRGERISYEELAELQSLAKHIQPGDVELLEAAGVPEFPETLEQRIRAAQAERCEEGPDFDFEQFDSIQAGIDSGMIWALQGAIGRNAMACLESGACFLPETQSRDYWGNKIPSRNDLKPGSKGTLENSARFYGVEL